MNDSNNISQNKTIHLNNNNNIRKKERMVASGSNEIMANFDTSDVQIIPRTVTQMSSNYITNNNFNQNATSSKKQVISFGFPQENNLDMTTVHFKRFKASY